VARRQKTEKCKQKNKNSLLLSSHFSIFMRNGERTNTSVNPQTQIREENFLPQQTKKKFPLLEFKEITKGTTKIRQI